jgi:hypothetical protein
VDTDEALTQLRRLREGRGLTTDRLRASGALLSALGTADAAEGVGRLREALRKLGDAPRFTALRVDLALQLDQETLGRPPIGQDYELLTARRSAHASVVQRDVKTLARWSDRACAELRAALIDDVFRGDLYVTGILSDGRLIATTFTRDDGDSRTTVDGPKVLYDDGPPILAFALPRDWRPATLSMALVTQRGSLGKVRLIIAEDFLSISASGERHIVEVRDGAAFVRVQAPRLDRIYTLWWHGNTGVAGPAAE